MAHKTAGALRYVLVWLGLVFFTLASFGLSYAHTGDLEAPIALGIAVIKTGLVLAFFMHLIEERATNVAIPFIAVGFIVLLLSLLATDVLTRHTFPPVPTPMTTPG